MTSGTSVRPRRSPAVAAATTGGAALAAIGALLSSGEIEVTLLMVATVLAGLAAFDRSMNRNLRRLPQGGEVDARQPIGPWIALSLAPVAKTVPTVLFELRTDATTAYETYDHVGTLLFALAVFVAIWLVAWPAEQLGSRIDFVDRTVVIAAAATAAIAGASIGFLYDRDFGSVAVARLLETATWSILGGTLAAVAVATGHTRRLVPTMAGLLAVATVTSGLAAVAVSGAEIDSGWWAGMYACIAALALFDRDGLPERGARDRPSNAAVVVAVVVGLVAAGCAIVARSDRDAWSPGWALLGVLSVALLLLALLARPGDDTAPATDRRRRGPTEIGVDPERAALARNRAERTVGAASADVAPHGASTRAATPALADGRRPETRPPQEQQPPQSEEQQTEVRRPDSQRPSVRTPSAPPETPVPASTGAGTGPTHQPADAPTSDTEPSAPRAPRTPDESPRAGREVPERPDTAAAEAVIPPPSSEAPPTLSGADIVRSARAAAEVRNAPAPERHARAPVEQAHHFDPSTGLLSAAGLQHALRQTFETPRNAGHVTLVVFTIRNLIDIERDHGRLAAAAVTRTLADRVRSLLPEGTGARFTRSAYAVVIVGDRSDSAATIKAMARVLVRFRAPIDTATGTLHIDVVAGMAQCYEHEGAGPFVERANIGLARAVKAPEPTLVAMP